MSQFFKYIYNIPLYDKLAVLIPKSQTLEFDTTDLLVSNKNKRILNKVFGSNLKNEWYNNIKKYILSKLKNDKIVIVSDYNENRGTNDDKISKDSQFVNLLFNYKNIERYYNYINYGNHVKFKNMCFIIVDFKQFFELLSSHVTLILKFLFIPMCLICLIPKEFPGVNNEKFISLANGANNPLSVMFSLSI